MDWGDATAIAGAVTAAGLAVNQWLTRRSQQRHTAAQTDQIHHQMTNAGVQAAVDAAEALLQPLTVRVRQLEAEIAERRREAADLCQRLLNIEGTKVPALERAVAAARAEAEEARRELEVLLPLAADMAIQLEDAGLTPDPEFTARYGHIITARRRQLSNGD